MGVDRYSGAFRVLRTGRDGSLALTPGPDWGRDLGDQVDLFDLAAIANSQDSPTFATPAWDWGLLTIQCNYDQADGIVPRLQIFALTTTLTMELVYAHPLLTTNEIFQLIFPALAPYHIARVVATTADASAYLKITAERLPPGFPIAPPSHTFPIFDAAAFNNTNEVLTHLSDPLARGWSIGYTLAAVGAPAASIAYLEATPWAGQANAPFWTMPIGGSNAGQATSRLPNYGPCILRYRQSATGPTRTLTVDLTPIRAS